MVSMQRALERQAVSEFLLGQLELGDVLRNAEHVRRLAVGVLHDMPQRMNPDDAPIHRALVGVSGVIERDIFPATAPPQSFPP